MRDYNRPINVLNSGIPAWKLRGRGRYYIIIDVQVGKYNGALKTSNEVPS